jgi:hypothetical protein
MGYVVPYPGNFWMLDAEETTPELRWPYSVRVYRQMLRQDCQVTSVFNAIGLPIERTRWRLAPNGARDEVVEQIADDLNLPIEGTDEPDKPRPRSRGRFNWSEHIRMALKKLQYGHMFFEQLYYLDDAGRARLSKLSPRMPATIRALDVAADGGLRSITQFGAGAGIGQYGVIVNSDFGTSKPIPINRLVAYAHRREGGDWFGESILRPAYKNWLIKDRLLRTQAQTIDRNGMGIAVYEGAPDDTDLSKGLAIAQGYRSGDNSGAAIPNGAKLRIQGVEGVLPDADPVVRYHDEQIARASLAHFLNLGTQTGSWALGSTFADFFVQSLQVTAQELADVGTRHIVEDIVDVNWGPDEPAPVIVFDEIGSMHDATAQAVATLVAAGVILPDKMLERAVRAQFSLPPADPAEPEPEPEPAAPAPDGPDPGEQPLAARGGRGRRRSVSNERQAALF